MLANRSNDSIKRRAGLVAGDSVKAFFLSLILMFALGCSSDPTDYVSFSLNGVAQNYVTDSFNYLITDEYLIDGYQSRVNPPDMSKNVLTLVVPRDVQTGSVYYETSAGARMEYIDNAGVTYYGSKGAAVFQISIVKWYGPGKYGTGLFGGTLYTADGTASVQITQGSFMGWIYN